MYNYGVGSKMTEDYWTLLDIKTPQKIRPNRFESQAVESVAAAVCMMHVSGDGNLRVF